MTRLVVIALVALAIAWAALFLTGSGVLVSESIVEPKENYVVRSRGTPRRERQAKLMCRYFTGMGEKTLEFWHAPTGIGGLSACPWFASVAN